MSVNTTKALTRGRAVIRTKDDSPTSFTIQANDGSISTLSPVVVRSSGQGTYPFRGTIPYVLGFENTVRDVVATMGGTTIASQDPPVNIRAFSTTSLAHIDIP